MQEYSEKDIENVCRIIENRLRSLGRDCEVIFLRGAVSIAPPAWPSDAVGETLYEALMEAEEHEN